MTSTGPSSATSTGMWTTFQSKKPIMGSMVQIKSDTHVTWIGAIPNSAWTDLKISTTDPQQSSQIHPMIDNSSFCEWSTGLDVKFSKEKRDLFSFQCKLLWYFQGMGMDTIMYLKDLGDRTKMVNLTQAYVKTAIKEQHKMLQSFE